MDRQLAERNIRAGLVFAVLAVLYIGN